jgi:protein-S-isoprenylcysteine O-methyltransferase Ste14
MNILELKLPPPVLALIFVAAMWFASWQLPSLAFEMPGSHYWGLVLAGTGIILALAGVIEVRKAETTVNPTKPDATSAMVTSGVYRLSRNPMYLGLLFVLAGWAAVLSHVLAFLFLPVFVAYINRFQITPEERVLYAKFGEAFTTYTQSVRKWL